MDPAVVSLLAEIWTEYAFGILFIAARVFARTRMVGVKGYDIDDYLIFIVGGLWTSVSVVAHIFIVVCGGIHTSELTHEQRESMSPEEYPAWEYGSQIFLFGLSLYFLIVWFLKFNMLCFYRRVVRGTWTERFVFPVMGLVVGSFLVIVLVMTLTCRPFYALWQVWPDPGTYCVPQNKVFFITILTFNILTDFCIMMIPIPVVWGIQTTLLKRMGIYMCFALGIFCMVAAILRYTLIFDLNQAGISASWSIREDFVAIFVGQAPLFVPVFRKRFWTGGGYTTNKSSSGGMGGESHELSSAPNSLFASKNDKKKKKDPYSMTQLGLNESEEEIVQKESAPSTASDQPVTRNASGKASGKNKPVDGIMVSRTINVKSIASADETTPKSMKKSWYYEVA